MKIPVWLKLSKKQIADFKVLIKAFLKGIVIAGSGALTVKLGGNIETAAAISGVTHALIKIIDPTDKSIGLKKK
jgi:hypothetical protein